jgi:hypothetical protein
VDGSLPPDGVRTAIEGIAMEAACTPV